MVILAATTTVAIVSSVLHEEMPSPTLPTRIYASGKVVGENHSADVWVAALVIGFSIVATGLVAAILKGKKKVE
jgi:hypothetical protein